MNVVLEAAEYMGISSGYIKFCNCALEEKRRILPWWLLPYTIACVTTSTEPTVQQHAVPQGYK